MLYLDYNATTPVDERVLAEMLPWFTENFGNAASKAHAYGWAAEEAVKHAREQVAQLINAEPSEIIFTSGATEAINLAIKGVYEAYHTKGNHIITVATEHKATLDTCKALEERGAEITYLPVNHDGIINLADLEAAITAKTILISVMLANNETGTIQDIAGISELAKTHDVLFMSDITQAIDKLAVDVQQLHIDIAPLSAHKFYGPKGIGALYVRRRDPRVSLTPLIHGGGHERGLRSGTLNVPGIVGIGKAAAIAHLEQPVDSVRITLLRNELEEGLKQIPGVVINGCTLHRLPNTLNISFTGLSVPTILGALSDKVAVSSGSACTSASLEPSYVLKAMGKDDETAYASIRFSLGRYTTEKDIIATIKEVKAVIERLASQ
jgi:cysteine desulfurase